MTLFAHLEKIPDPRSKRGVRHPSHSILKLVVWGFACRLLTVEHICAAAKGVWKRLGKEIGDPRSNAPDATTVRRVLEAVGPSDLQNAFELWVSELLDGKQELVGAVDGKVIRNLSDGEGGAQKVLNIFAHDLKLVLAQRDIEPGQGEAPALAEALKGLFERYPGLSILTGDAAYCGRSLCQQIKDAGRDYVVQVKQNQPQIYERLKQWFSEEMESRRPDAVLKKRTLVEVS